MRCYDRHAPRTTTRSYPFYRCDPYATHDPGRPLTRRAIAVRIWRGATTKLDPRPTWQPPSKARETEVQHMKYRQVHQRQGVIGTRIRLINGARIGPQKWRTEIVNITVHYQILSRHIVIYRHQRIYLGL
jgi:hypothetical protein